MSSLERSRGTTALWVLTAVILLGMLVMAFVPGLRMVLIVVEVGFALLHGAGNGLLIGGNARVQRRADGTIAFNCIALQHAHAPAATRAAVECEVGKPQDLAAMLPPPVG